MITCFSNREEMTSSGSNIPPWWVGEHRVMTAHVLPAIGSWQGMPSGRFQDALVLNHASAGIQHSIKESCGHPAVILRCLINTLLLGQSAGKRIQPPANPPTPMDHRPAMMLRRGMVWRKEARLAWSGKATVYMLYWTMSLPEAQMHVWTPEATLVLYGSLEIQPQ